MHPIPLVAIDGEQNQPTFYNMVGSALTLSLSAAFHRNGWVNWDSPRQKSKSECTDLEHFISELSSEL